MLLSRHNADGNRTLIEALRLSEDRAVRINAHDLARRENFLHFTRHTCDGAARARRHDDVI